MSFKTSNMAWVYDLAFSFISQSRVATDVQFVDGGTAINTPGWPEKPWTIVSQAYGGKDGGIAHRYYAYNLVTKEHGPLRDYYEQAMDDIKEKYVFSESPYAEPWGV